MDDWWQALAALAHKYRDLIVLCGERDALESDGVHKLAGEARARRHARARQLARRFPGALRELDTATIAGLSRRLGNVEDELELRRPREMAPRWMQMVVAFHDELRARLRVKAAVARGEPVTSAEVMTIADPPYGRLQELVWQRLAERYGVTPETARAVVFGGHE